MKKENTQVGFALKGIKTEQFAIFEENYSPKKETSLGTELQFKLDQNNKQIAVFLGFEFLQGKKVFLKIQVSCHFKIEESSWNSLIQENKLIVPKGFLAHLAMITTGTSRGVLFAKTEATPFSTFI
nr:hypothetical protein [Paludibacteraceae bacterium]